MTESEKENPYRPTGNEEPLPEGKHWSLRLEVYDVAQVGGYVHDCVCCGNPCLFRYVHRRRLYVLASFDVPSARSNDLVGVVIFWCLSVGLPALCSGHLSVGLRRSWLGFDSNQIEKSTSGDTE